jgi:hypothetical protein
MVPKTGVAFDAEICANKTAVSANNWIGKHRFIFVSSPGGWPISVDLRMSRNDDCIEIISSQAFANLKESIEVKNHKVCRAYRPKHGFEEAACAEANGTAAPMRRRRARKSDAK